MKKHIFNTGLYILFVAALGLASLPCNAAESPDNPDGLILNKSVSPEQDANGNYWITLDAYVTGSVEVVSEYPGLDVVLVLDVSSSLNKTEIATLKSASKAFVNQLINYKGDAKVGIVTFSKGATELTNGLVSAKDNGADLLSKIDGLSNTGDATYVNMGMYYGSRMILNLPSNSSRKRVLVLFTDGEPTSSKTSAGKDRNPYAQAMDAINFSYQVKQAGCEVYTVAIGIHEKYYIYPGGTSADVTQQVGSYYIQMDEFLQHISSKYPNAYADGTVETANYLLSTVKKNWTSPVVTSPAYYQSVTDKQGTAKLAEVFESISREVTSVPAINVTEKAVIKDGITKDFQLPENFDKSQIQTYTAVYDGVDGSGNPKWGELTSFAATKDFYSKDGSDYITVTNFNFNDNWCGDNKGANHGKKLVIKFPITPKPDCIGGPDIPTNTPDSGIYIDDEPIGHFDIPAVDLPIRIVVRKEGLLPNESAIITVSRINGDTMTTETTVMLTGKEGQDYAEATIVNLDPNYVYQVAETGWSWSYTPSGATSFTTSSASNPIVFKNVKTDDTPKNAEAMVRNEFN